MDRRRAWASARRDAAPPHRRPRRGAARVHVAITPVRSVSVSPAPEPSGSWRALPRTCRRPPNPDPSGAPSRRDVRTTTPPRMPGSRYRTCAHLLREWRRQRGLDASRVHDPADRTVDIAAAMPSSLRHWPHPRYRPGELEPLRRHPLVRQRGPGRLKPSVGHSAVERRR